MTTKRFKLYKHKGNDYILDNPKEYLDFIEMLGDTLTSEEIVDLLNDLHEENKNLKDFAQHNYSETKKIINNLQKENEELKQQIQQLQHWNKCLAEKRHQELSYRPYTVSKSEKELKKLLESKLFNCSDR